MKVFTKLSLVVLAVFGFSAAFGQNNPWSDVPESSVVTNDAKMKITPDKYRTLALDINSFVAAIKSAPKEFTDAAKVSPLILSIPMPDGGFQRFKVVESPMMEPELAAKFPEIKTFSGQGIDDPYATAKFDWSPGRGFHSMILSDVNGSAFIDPYTYGSTAYYISYYKHDLKPKDFVEDGILYPPTEGDVTLGRTDAGQCLGTTLRSYRAAVACTHQYATAVGGTTVPLALAAITTTMNRVNGVYEKEVAIRLTLVANNDQIVFVTAASDPFTGNSSAGTLINESQTQITAIIGSANFDIGHTFSTGGGGLAGLGVVCNNANKARGITGSSNPTGDPYDIDYVAHEMGHQFGGNHTFNASTGSCGGNGSSSSNAEPGSGSSIMAYAGICGSQNLQSNSDPFFHAISFNQIGTYSTLSTGNTCAVQIATGNSLPVVNAGPGYTIPKSTPFMLTGSATDADGDALTYSWEQIDVGGPYGNWNSPSGNAPLFRSFRPTISPTRFFPKQSDLVGNTTTIGEILPSYGRTMNFRLTARDNKAGGGGVCFAENAVVVDGNSGPFVVTSQSTATSWTANGSNTATITWSVNNTNVAPVSCVNVEILLSVDGGYSYPYTLLGTTANDGTENIVIPSVPTTKGRIMVRAKGNVFFSINAADITITSACTGEGAEVTPGNEVKAVVGNAALNLGLSPLYASPLSISGTLSSTDPSANLAVYSSVTFGCVQFGNTYRYDTYTFQPSQTGPYTFTFNGGANQMIANLYNGSYNSGTPCNNFMTSNGTFNPTPSPGAVVIGNSINAFLTQGNAYVLTIGTFSSSFPTLPANYSMTVSTTPAGGTIYAGANLYFNPGGAFTYAYVIVNNATGLIKEIKSNSDLTNSSTYPAGTYTVYGISYTTSQAAVLNSYVGQSFLNLQTAIFNTPGTLCANLSKNSVVVTVTAPLPVTDLALKARKSGSNVALDWSTATEQNTAYFMIERSTDGREFYAILDKVNAAGNSNAEKHYAAIDNAPSNGWNYYRIKQFDLDGKYTYSNVAAVNFNHKINSLVIYPNPAKEKLTVEFEASRSGKVTLDVIDSKGAIVFSKALQAVVGRNMETVQVNTLSTGVYILRTIDAEGNVTHTKFIKQ